VIDLDRVTVEDHLAFNNTPVVCAMNGDEAIKTPAAWGTRGIARAYWYDRRVCHCCARVVKLYYVTLTINSNVVNHIPSSN
jgi:hypothetical protein